MLSLQLFSMIGLLLIAIMLMPVVEGMKAPNGPYSVSGNVVRDRSGASHIFRGFARPSLEW